MKKTILTVAALFGLTAAGGAFAQTLDFNTLDADFNGEVSFEELQVALPNITPEDFALLDTDGNGALSPEEFEAFLASSPDAAVSQ